MFDLIAAEWLQNSHTSFDLNSSTTKQEKHSLLSLCVVVIEEGGKIDALNSTGMSIHKWLKRERN